VDPFPPEDREALRRYADSHHWVPCSLARRIRELEALIKEIEQKIREIQAQNADFRALLNQKDSNLTAVRASMEQRLAEQQQRFMKENQMLKDELDQLMALHAADKKQFLAQLTSSQPILPTSHLGERGYGARAVICCYFIYC
jgi:chromosome segregation ATPase